MKLLYSSMVALQQCDVAETSTELQLDWTVAEQQNTWDGQ